jgi:5'-deoxynucleotidase YfbR-like HD superfamily hydrolase
MNAERHENTAEHSWHLAIMAILLAEHANEAVDVARVVKMVLIHDVVEIDAGDTYYYDAVGLRDKAERERRAADRCSECCRRIREKSFVNSGKSSKRARRPRHGSRQRSTALFHRQKVPPVPPAIE